ncbi:MAG: TerD family protein [Bacteroidota bacterium]
MAISLQKGQNVSLDKEAPGMQEIHAGLGWDVQQFAGEDFDLDVVLFLTGADGKVLSDHHFIFFNNLTSPDGSVVHSGDNRTGEGEGDDEIINVSLAGVDDGVQKIVFAVDIHEGPTRSQNFGQVQNAFIRLVDKATNEEMIRYDLSEDFSIETSVIAAELYRKDGGWKFKAVGQGFQDGLAALCRHHGVNV